MSVFDVSEDSDSDDLRLCHSCPGRFIPMACGPPEDEQDMAADADFDLDVRCAIFGDYSQVPAMVCPPDWETHAEFDCRLRDFLTTKMSDLAALIEK